MRDSFNSSESEDIRKDKEYFLKTQFWYLTLAASFARANIYKNHNGLNDRELESRKRQLRLNLFNWIEHLVFEQYTEVKISPEKHIKNINDLVTQSSEFSDILDGGKFRFGIAQKILNLYLKYLWCADYIPQPPHFPLDRMIQEGILGEVLTNWTKLNDPSEYEKIIGHSQFGLPDAYAISELKSYNKILVKSYQVKSREI